MAVREINQLNKISCTSRGNNVVGSRKIAGTNENLEVEGGKTRRLEHSL